MKTRRAHMGRTPHLVAGGPRNVDTGRQSYDRNRIGGEPFQSVPKGASILAEVDWLSIAAREGAKCGTGGDSATGPKEATEAEEGGRNRANESNRSPICRPGTRRSPRPIRSRWRDSSARLLRPCGLGGGPASLFLQTAASSGRRHLTGLGGGPASRTSSAVSGRAPGDGDAHNGGSAPNYAPFNPSPRAAASRGWSRANRPRRPACRSASGGSAGTGRRSPTCAGSSGSIPRRPARRPARA
jgi:hypothetical protein